MAISSFKNDKRSSPANLDIQLEEAVDRIVKLAHEARHEKNPSRDIPSEIPDFNRALKVTGRTLLASDGIAMLMSFLGGWLGTLMVSAVFFDGSFQELIGLATAQHIIIFISLGTMTLLWLDTKGHYRQRLPYWETLGQILAVSAVGFIGSGFIEFAAKSPSSRLWMGLSWVLFAAFSLLGRYATRHHLDRNGLWQIPAIVIGRGTTSNGALQALSREKQMGFTIVGQFPGNTLPQLNDPLAWKRLLMAHKATHIFLALEGSEIERNPGALKAMVRSRVPCSIVPPWLGLPSSTLSPHHFMMHDVMMFHDNNRLELPFPKFLKRSFDILASGSALVLLAPVFAVIALMVRRDGGSAFFSQARIGKNGKIFKCHKFRSMRVDADKILNQYLVQSPAAADEWRRFQKLKNDVRITSFGQFIRSTSIDELPQLFNVLKGDMSLVGPRPCMPGQEVFYAEDFSFYTSVRPGISGPWQVSGRNKLTFKERVGLEAWYVRNWSLWMDVVILLKTIPTVLKKGQAY